MADQKSIAQQSYSARYYALHGDRIKAEQKRAYRAGEIRSHPRPPRLYEHCVVCGAEIPTTRRVDAKYCSRSCDAAMHLIRKQARRAAGTEFKESTERLKERYKAWTSKNPASIRAYAKVRRARRANVFAEHIKSDEVFQRDGWVCQLCKRPTPRKLIGTKSPHRPTIDHIVPLSKGGPHTFQNVQCACARCNGRKWATTKGQFRLF